MKCIFIANAAVGNGLSGSDRIFIELAKRWSKAQINISICVWEDGYEMCNREGLKENAPNIIFIKWFLGKFKRTPFILNYFLRIFSGVYYASILKIEVDETTYIYACSDFWQDAIPALILKLRYPTVKLIGSFYLTAPNPFVGFYEGDRKKLPTIKGILYWLQQQPIKALLSKFADIVFVTSEPDAKKFNNSIIIRGGVNVAAAKEYFQKNIIEEKIYDAVFLGRFHPQKGVLELIDIWKLIVEQIPSAKLIMIGDGPEKSSVEKKIDEYNLKSNIELKGYLFDGNDKYEIFKKSKIVVHPAVYDSGGMAAAEAMAWGLPGIAFDLEALKSYYPKGMLKIPFGNYELFAKGILNLLNDKNSYEEMSSEARNLVMDEWDWDKRALIILNQIKDIDRKLNQV